MIVRHCYLGIAFRKFANFSKIGKLENQQELCFIIVLLLQNDYSLTMPIIHFLRLNKYGKPVS